MGKKTKGKKGLRVATDLESFNKQALKVQQEKEFVSKPKTTQE
jgi:hypothetical protein